MINASPFPTILHAHGGEILRVNAAFTALTGHRREDVPMFTVMSERMKPTDNAARGDQPAHPEGEHVITTANRSRRFRGRWAATRPGLNS